VIDKREVKTNKSTEGGVILVIFGRNLYFIFCIGASPKFILLKIELVFIQNFVENRKKIEKIQKNIFKKSEKKARRDVQFFL